MKWPCERNACAVWIVGVWGSGDRAGRVRRNDTQALPGLGFKAGSELFEQVCAQGVKSPRGEAASGLAERPITELSPATGLARQCGEQAIEFGLNAGAHPGEHHRQQAGKGEQALAGKSGGR